MSGENREVVVAGSLESGDVHVTFSAVAPIPAGADCGAGAVAVEVDSPVAARFAPAIVASVREVLAQQRVTGVAVKVSDRGALDYVLRARVETAARRWRERPVSEVGA